MKRHNCVFCAKLQNIVPRKDVVSDMEKSTKTLVAIIFLLMVLLLSGCGREEGDGQADCPVLWYEKHVVEGKRYSVIAVTKEESYSCYYGNHKLTATYTDKQGKKTEKKACLPKQFHVQDMGVDKKGNIYVLCGDLKEKKRTLWQLDEKGKLKEKERQVLLFEDTKRERFIGLKGVNMEQGGRIYIW